MMQVCLFVFQNESSFVVVMDSRSRGVMVITLDFESNNPSSSLGGTFYSFFFWKASFFLFFLVEGEGTNFLF